jgi:putative spermidine/putrescine transport system ATP-binding protein
VPGRIETANFLGGHTLYRVVAEDGRQVLAKEINLADRPGRAIGDQVSLRWDAGDVVRLEG